VSGPGEFPAAVVEAAVHLGCRPQDLLGWRLLPDGSVVLIAPNGAKLRVTLARPSDRSPGKQAPSAGGRRKKGAR
jgi:hypothetical protein